LIKNDLFFQIFKMTQQMIPESVTAQYSHCEHGLVPPPSTPPPSHTTSIPLIGIDRSVLRLLIGKKGKNMIDATERHQLEKIWHNKVSDDLEFYGPYHKCCSAMNQVMDILTWAVNIRLSQLDDEVSLEDEVILEECDIEFDYLNKLEMNHVSEMMVDESQFPVL
jgi:hypothetical protein